MPTRRKRKRKRKRTTKLPNKLIVIKNPDKGFHEKWYSGRNKLNIPHPFRCLLLGPPNSGKTCIIKNLLLRQDKPFEKLVIVHCSPEYTKEYEDCSGEIMAEIPPRQFFDDNKKTLVVLEDINFKGMHKIQKHRLNRLYGNWSTHNNLSICSTSQDFFELPPIVRRCTNFWILWKGVDLDEMQAIAKKMGLTSSKLMSLFALCRSKHDSVWLDYTEGTPFSIRLNGFKLVKLK